MGRLRQLHTLHHRPELMQTHNFNITYPIGDWLFGTLYRGRRKPAPPRPRQFGRRGDSGV
jgi:sterol desaturase/sphingolipid hydroxylase (fatty acid hydroxylase superfamily)